MKTVWIREFGNAENLEVRNVSDLVAPVADRVLVKVKAAGLNRADLLQRRGFYPPPKGFPQEIPGLEFAGETIEIGQDVQTFKIGQRVMGITASAAQAEFVCVPENTLVEIPQNLNFVEAAAVPEVFITAHDALFTQADLRMGESVLIHAVGSGVGLAGLQLAKAAGAQVFGTSRTADKLEKAKEYGPGEGIAVENVEKISEIINEKTGGKGVNVVIDLVGASYFDANLQSLANLGRLVFVGTTAGTKAGFDISIVMRKRLRLFGTVLRSRTNEEKAVASRLFAEQVVPLLSRGAIKPIVDRVFKFEEIRKAHEYLESNQSFGKVVLEIE